MHDDYRVVDAHPGRDREQDRIAKKGVGEMVEHVGLVLFLPGRRVQLGHLVEDVRAPGIVEQAGENRPGRARLRCQLEADGDAVDHHDQTGALTDMIEKGTSFRPGSELDHGRQVSGRARLVLAEVKLGDPAVTPEILIGHGRRAHRKPAERGQAPLNEPSRAAERLRDPSRHKKGVIAS